jgi:hypothetical protein
VCLRNAVSTCAVRENYLDQRARAQSRLILTFRLRDRVVSGARQKKPVKHVPHFQHGAFLSQKTIVMRDKIDVRPKVYLLRIFFRSQSAVSEETVSFLVPAFPRKALPRTPLRLGLDPNRNGTNGRRKRARSDQRQRS